LVTDDKEFYANRINLVETDGWIDLIEELKTLSESVKRIDSIDNERDLWFARGQLSILRQMIVLEEATKTAMTELDL
jgi:hypothetical protein|tara:strand:- start:242 stop:472 length:231 start_codon:yes stop_codon:yes gene_type:complete